MEYKIKAIEDKGDEFEVRVKCGVGIEKLSFKKNKKNQKKVSTERGKIPNWKKKLEEKLNDRFDDNIVFAEDKSDELIIDKYTENKETFTVIGKLRGTRKKHTFPKNGKWLKIEDGVPRYAKKLKELIEKKENTELTPSNEVGNRYKL